MQTFTPKMFVLCVLLAVGPPAGVVAYYYRDFLLPAAIDPRTASGELLFFTSSGCPACHRMKPAVAHLRNEGFDIRTVDVGSQQEKAMRYGIRVVPTFVLVRDGEEVRRASGVTSDESLRQLWR